MELSIIIVSYNTYKLLKECLYSVYDSIENCGFERSIEVIVVDNHSTDGTIEMIKSYFPKVKIIINDKNYGFGFANNQGIRISKSKYILFLNSDTVVFKNTIKDSIKIIKNDTSIKVLGVKLLNRDGSIQQSIGYFPTIQRVIYWMFFIDDIPLFQRFIKPYHLSNTTLYHKILSIDWVSGAFLLANRETIIKAGLFDSSVFMYVEEVDLCYRIKKLGGDIIYNPNITIKHEKGASSTKEIAGLVEEYKGLKYFYKKHYSGSKSYLLSRLLYLGALLRVIFFGIIRGSGKKREIYLECLKVAR